MSPLDLTLLFFLLLAILNYRTHRSVLYPPFIFCAMWFIDLAVLRSGLIEIDEVHGNTLAIVAAGAASFSMGGFLAGFAPRTFLRMHLFPPAQARHPGFLRNILMIAMLCGLPILFYQILQLSRSADNGLNFLLQARLALVESIQNGETSTSTLMDDFVMISTIVSLLFATGKKDWQFWVVTAVAVGACILSTGRTSLFLLISGLCAIRLLQSKQESLLDAIRLLRWPMALFLALFIGLIFTNKQTQGMTGGAAGIASFYLLSYIVGPLAAFDNVVQHPADFMTTSSHTFESPLHWAARLHLTDYTAPPLFDSWVFVPFPTNVYTVFKFYFLELGITGTLVLLFFIGLVHSLLYLKARQGGRLSTYLFAYSMFPVLMVIFDDHYNKIGIYLYVLAFGLIYSAIGSIPFRLLPRMRANPRNNLPLSADSTVK